ncbi:uncharacterized protein N7458_004628 [Penicillium daleae]|uniref:Uncharacterized protein n=1 Tax=Penicillium daleae TaxID=63821 RepID=A0AAD6G3L8_9EURO|nr:uncharacterized protein N7458_004628 [Penicillium daleae]KAJ5453672.1 hypothetical protein N7458_004628 [Penicillium daleae]
MTSLHMLGLPALRWCEHPADVFWLSEPVMGFHYTDCDCELCLPSAATLLLLGVNDEDGYPEDLVVQRLSLESRVIDKIRMNSSDHETHGVLHGIKTRFKSRTSIFSPGEINIVQSEWDRVAKSSMHEAPGSWLSLILIAVLLEFTPDWNSRGLLNIIPPDSLNENFSASKALKQAVSLLMEGEARSYMQQFLSVCPDVMFRMKWSRKYILGHFLFLEEEPCYGGITNSLKVPNEWAIKYLGVGPGAEYHTTNESQQDNGHNATNADGVEE